jgi:hypothetical protein
LSSALATAVPSSAAAIAAAEATQSFMFPSCFLGES